MKKSHQKIKKKKNHQDIEIKKKKGIKREIMKIQVKKEKKKKII